MLTVLYDMVRRGHRPRDPSLRTLMRLLGFHVPERERDYTPKAHEDDEDGDSEGHGEMGEEEPETDDEIIAIPGSYI